MDREGAVCELCLEAVQEATMSLGLALDDDMHVLARTSGGDIFEHECEADNDLDEVECHCGCRGN